TIYISMVLVLVVPLASVVLRYWAPLPTTGLKALAISGFLKRSMPIWADAEEATNRQTASRARPIQQRFMGFSLRTPPAIPAMGQDSAKILPLLISVSWTRRNGEAEEKSSELCRKSFVCERFDRIEA